MGDGPLRHFQADYKVNTFYYNISAFSPLSLYESYYNVDVRNLAPARFER